MQKFGIKNKTKQKPSTLIHSDDSWIFSSFPDLWTWTPTCISASPSVHSQASQTQQNSVSWSFFPSQTLIPWSMNGTCTYPTGQDWNLGVIVNYPPPPPLFFLLLFNFFIFNNIFPILITLFYLFLFFLFSLSFFLSFFPSFPSEPCDWQGLGAPAGGQAWAC